jgi:hypothetical protein
VDLEEPINRADLCSGGHTRDESVNAFPPFWRDIGESDELQQDGDLLIVEKQAVKRGTCQRDPRVV